MSPILDHITLLLFAFMLTMVGALPPGLVNLTIADKAFHNKNSEAGKIAIGASVIEMMYGLLSIIFGKAIQLLFEQNRILMVIVILVLGIIGVYFLLKRNKEVHRKTLLQTGFLKGIVLNLISIQVLLYWLVAVTFMMQFIRVEIEFFSILTFLTGIWIGKIVVLKAYQLIGQKAYKNINSINKNTNKIIGLLMLGAALSQLVKI